MPLTASVADVVARWRSLSTAESNLAAVLVGDALRKLRIARPALQGLIDDADTAAAAPGATAAQIQTAQDWEDTVRETVASVVIRVMINPDRLRSTSIGADGSIGVSYDNTEVDRARLGFTGADLTSIDAMIRATTGSGSVFSIGLTSLATEAQTAPSALPTP